MTRIAITSRQTLNQAQNYLRNSDDFSQATWTKENVTATTTTQGNPLSTELSDVTCSVLTENSATNFHSVYPTTVITMTAGQWWTASVFLKSNTRTFGGIYIDMGIGSNYTFANISTASVSGSGDSSTTATVIRSVERMQNGWCRVSMSMLQKTTVVVLPRCIMSNNGTSFLYVGDGASSLYFWRAQFVNANWAGHPTQTAGSPDTTPIRNRVTSRASITSRAAIT